MRLGGGRRIALTTSWWTTANSQNPRSRTNDSGVRSSSGRPRRRGRPLDFDLVVDQLRALVM